MNWYHKIPYSYKLAITVNLLILAALFFLSSSVINKQTGLIEQQFRDSGMTVVRQLADSSMELVFAERQLALNSLVNGLSQLDQVLGTTVYDANGKVITSAGITPPDNIYSRYIANQPIRYNHELSWALSGAESELSNPFDINSDLAGSQLVSFVHPIKFRNVVGGHALVTVSKAHIQTAVTQAQWSLAGLAVTLSILVMMVIVLVTRRFSRPISDLVEATHAIAEEQYGFRIRSRHHGEFGQLVNSFNSMAEGLEEKLQVETVFSRFVSDQVAHTFMDDLDQVQLGGKRVNASVLFVDIVGFTSLSERTSPEKVTELLNEYFGYFSYAANCYGGIVDKFIGDCAMLVFGAPQPDHQHEFHAVACSVLIQTIMDEMNIRRLQNGLEPVEVRLGISSGSMLAGILGSPDRMQYTVVGDHVNLASRLCSLAKPGQNVVDRDFFLRANRNNNVEGVAYQSVAVKGKQDPVDTFVISGLKGLSKSSVEHATQHLMSPNHLQSVQH